MKAYSCRACGNALYFENSVCVSCGTPLGYSRAERAIVPVEADGSYVDAAGSIWHVCRNLGLSGCTWLAPLAGGQCFACDLTRTRPADDDLAGIERFPVAERAKRHLVAELDGLGIEVLGRNPATGGDPERGLCFDLLSDQPGEPSVMIGHDEGVITINLAESDDAYRERMRDQLDEPYRTMLGHFRHEVGHYYQWQLIESSGEQALVDRARALFGDERGSYEEAVEQHYKTGAPAQWRDSFISAYATMHPYEDFAETWAHYLHISDTLETAVEFGLVPAAQVIGRTSFSALVSEVWVPLTIALNLINRSMGDDDLYPFVIPGPVLGKLDFVASLRSGVSLSKRT